MYNYTEYENGNHSTQHYTLLLCVMCCDCILRSYIKTASLFVEQKLIWADTPESCQSSEHCSELHFTHEALTVFRRDWSEWIWRTKLKPFKWIIKHINAMISFIWTTMLWPLKTTSSALKHHSCWGGKNPFHYAHGFSTDRDVHGGRVDIRMTTRGLLD